MPAAQKPATEILEGELRSLVSPFVAVVITPTSSYGDSTLQAVSTLSENSSCVYVTINKPYARLDALFTQNNIDTSKIIFVDVISQVASGKTANTKNCIYLSSPSNLTELSMAILEGMKHLGGKKFLIIDSISTLSMYNKPELIMRFMNSISSALPRYESDAVFFVLEGEQSAKIKEISTQFCDKVIDLGAKA